MANKSPFRKTTKGVSFIDEELQYLDGVVKTLRTDRSTVINALIRDYRERGGDPQRLLGLIFNMNMAIVPDRTTS